MTGARHSSESTRWGTPTDVVEMSRDALGGFIDLDPMSESTFDPVIRSQHYWTEQDDAFAQPHWKCSTMLINPPGGLVVRAWERLAAEFHAGNVGMAIWIGFSIEQLAILADHDPHPMDFSLLICRKRISFVRHDGKQGSPSHGNYVCALGVMPSMFEMAFAGRGRFSHGKLVAADDDFGFGAAV